MKKYFLLLPFLLLGLYLTFYPQINTVVYDCQAEQAITAWETQVEQAKESNRPHPGKDAVLLYPELYEAMQAYNQKIAEEKQSGLTSPDVYEEPALFLSDYGLDDDRHEEVPQKETYDEREACSEIRGLPGDALQCIQAEEY